MKLKNMPKEELELMGYDDIAILVLEESGKKMKINDIFKKVCDALNLTDADFENKIADFFEILSTNKNFIMLENGFWDLKSKHNVKIVIDEDEDEASSELVTDIDEEEDLEENEEDIFYESEETDDEVEDDLEDLVVIDEDDDETNSI